MQISGRQLALVLSSAAMALLTATAHPSSAAPVSFTIDPALSSYHIVNIQTDGRVAPGATRG